MSKKNRSSFRKCLIILLHKKQFKIRKKYANHLQKNPLHILMPPNVEYNKLTQT